MQFSQQCNTCKTSTLDIKIPINLRLKDTGKKGGGGAVAQSVERATPGEEVPGSISAVAARSLLVVSVSV